MANIKEVAKAAGVSPSTVSRVLSANISVAHATREKVLKAVKALNYQPKAVADLKAKGVQFNDVDPSTEPTIRKMKLTMSRKTHWLPATSLIQLASMRGICFRAIIQLKRLAKPTKNSTAAEVMVVLSKILGAPIGRKDGEWEKYIVIRRTEAGMKLEIRDPVPG